jgi:uncharacterized membrane protein
VKLTWQKWRDRARAVWQGLTAPLCAGFAALSWCHRLWFLVIFLASFAFMVFIPPFQTNDEPSHWRRAWSTARGHLTCGDIPVVVEEAIEAANYYGVRDRREKFRFSQWESMRSLVGHNKERRANGNACVYIPFAYVLPAAAMTPLANPYDLRESAGMLQAFYVARGANWLLMGAAVMLFLVLAPPLRNLTLVLYSLPTTMQQTVSINQESTILLCMFILLLLWWRRPSLQQILGLLAVIFVLAAMKAIHLVLLLLWACALWRWRKTSVVPPRRLYGIAALALIPVIIQAMWSKFVVSVSGSDYLPGWGVDPGLQVEFIKSHPLDFVMAMLRGHAALFGTGHMNGGWTGVLGVLGWADFEIGTRAYLMLTVAIVVALLCDFAAPPIDAPGEERSTSPWIRYVAPVFSIYLIISAVILAMYLVFTKVGAAEPIGVQGRYLLLPYFGMLALTLDWARRRFGRSRLRVWLQGWSGRLSWVCAVLCCLAARDAFAAILRMYHSA